MPNFRNSKIYRLVSMFTTDEYIGSTTEELNKRFSSHKNLFKRWLDGKTNYTSSFQLIMYYDVKIELIETYPCLTFEELLEREEYWKNRTPNCCNERGAICKNIYKREYIKKNKLIHGCDYCNHYFSNKKNLHRHERSQKHLDNVELMHYLIDN